MGCPDGVSRRGVGAGGKGVLSGYGAVAAPSERWSKVHGTAN